MMSYSFPPNMKEPKAIPDVMSQSMEGIAGVEDYMYTQEPFSSPIELNSSSGTIMNIQNRQNHTELMCMLTSLQPM